MVTPPQARERECWQTDSAGIRRPVQPSNSLASITGAAIQSIFQYLDVASAANLASTCKVCFDEQRHQSADIYERAYQKLTPEVTVEFVHTYWWENCSGVCVTVHMADETLLLQMYRIALRRKALQEFWSVVLPANLHELIWTTASEVGVYDWLAEYCKHYTETPFFIIWIKAFISREGWKSPLPDAWAHDSSLDKAVVESLGSAWERASVTLSVAEDTTETTGYLKEYFRHEHLMKDTHSSANASDNNDIDWDEAHAMLEPDPEFVWDPSLDWMHEVPSETNSYVQQDQIFACEPVGQLRGREYTHRVFSVRNRKCHANRQADNRIKQSRNRLGKHVTAKHKRVGLVQWEVMLDCDVFV